MITVFGRGNSSKLLAKALGVKRNDRRADVFIRWKNLEALPYCRSLRDLRGPLAFKEINKLEAVKNASNKYKSLCLMKEAELNVPKFTKLQQVVEEDIDLNPKHLWFGRDNYHSKGLDIEIYGCDNINPLEGGGFYKNHDYYIQYMKPRAEYRYHVAFGKVILPTKKILAEGEIDDSLIRNHQNGKWRQVVCRETERFASACIKAVACHSLDFGAVDFLNIDGDPFMLEVNTAPGLQVENRLEAYIKAFKEYLSF